MPAWTSDPDLRRVRVSVRGADRGLGILEVPGVSRVGGLDALRYLRPCHPESHPVTEFVPRQARDRRRKGVAVQLGERDLELLRALARFRIASTSDVMNLCFRGIRRDTASVRLRRLFDAGYLDVTAHDRYSENQYSLGPAGRAVILGEGGLVGRVPRGSAAHHLAIVAAWVALANHDQPGVRLELVRADWELREEFADQGLELFPDLFAIFGIADGHRAVAVEVDLGTEPLCVLRSKFARYDATRRGPNGLFGWTAFSLLVFAPTATTARRDSIAGLLLDGSCGAVCGSPSDIRSALRGLLAGGEPPLTAPPCGKGTVITVSDDASAQRRPDDAGL